MGPGQNENPARRLIIEELTELLEAAAAGFERIAERGAGRDGNRLPARRIQDESMPAEMLKHTGELPIIGVNTFRNPHGDAVQDKLEPGLPTEASRASSAA
jgi:methylmalonyl-CoA mutase